MLFCLTANYTPKALEAMGKNPSNRREAVEKLLTAAGGKLVAMYGTIAVEVKAPDGKPTAEQAECLAQCEAAGATVAIEYGLDACLARLEAWSILRGRADALSVI